MWFCIRQNTLLCLQPGHGVDHCRTIGQSIFQLPTFRFRASVRVDGGHTQPNPRSRCDGRRVAHQLVANKRIDVGIL